MFLTFVRCCKSMTWVGVVKVLFFRINLIEWLIERLFDWNWFLHSTEWIPQSWSGQRKRPGSNICFNPEIYEIANTLLTRQHRLWYKKTFVLSIRLLEALYTSFLGRPVHSVTNSTSLGSIQPSCNYCMKLFTQSHSHISTTVNRQVLIYKQLSFPCRCWQNQNAPKDIIRRCFEPSIFRLRVLHSTTVLYCTLYHVPFVFMSILAAFRGVQMILGCSLGSQQYLLCQCMIWFLFSHLLVISINGCPHWTPQSISTTTQASLYQLLLTASFKISVYF